MEKYFGNAYRGDPGIPHTDPDRFLNIWIGSAAFSALAWFNPYMWQLTNQWKFFGMIKLCCMSSTTGRRPWLRSNLINSSGMNTWTKMLETLTTSTGLYIFPRLLCDPTATSCYLVTWTYCVILLLCRVIR